ncbi:MAG: hypothetical protein J6Y29_04785, partial [Clostridiales bacterium]|nr:hypothetical protein [Clostridiales bacterium]
VCPAGTVTILVNAMFAIPVENLPIEFTFSFPFHTVIDFTTVSALIQKRFFKKLVLNLILM